jgi:segregation and condensation protein B
MTHPAQLEAILFFKAEPVTFKRLAELTQTSIEEVQKSLSMLQETLSGRGVQLVLTGDSAQLVTAPAASELMERITREDIMKDLGKAGLETLTIILYRGPIARRDIDYIRGVNSTFIIRNLLIRGLVERVENPQDERVHLYRATIDTLRYLGIARVEDLPEFADVQAAIQASVAAAVEKEQEQDHDDERNQPSTE